MMKLTIGENIRDFRKKNDLTQEALAERLGVTYQSVSRWENGATYPDLELLPAISEVLAVTIDKLLGMPQVEKEKRAAETFDELRRECMKPDYDADRIVMLLRDIRRNYLDSAQAWCLWSEGNNRAFRDPGILPEVRLLAEAYLARNPMHPHTIATMASIEDEEHLDDFLQKYTTSFDCSARALLFDRYLQRGDAQRFAAERRFQLYQAFDSLVHPIYLLDLGDDTEQKAAADEFESAILSLIRRDAADDRADIWVTNRMDLELKSAARSAALGKLDEAILTITAVVELLEDTMSITDEVLLPTSCRFLDGMEWCAMEDWHERDNHPDSPKERFIFIYTKMGDAVLCNCVHPSIYLDTLQGNDFDPLRSHPHFKSLCERVRALIITKPKEH